MKSWTINDEYHCSLVTDDTTDIRSESSWKWYSPSDPDLKSSKAFSIVVVVVFLRKKIRDENQKKW